MRRFRGIRYVVFVCVGYVCIAGDVIASVYPNAASPPPCGSGDGPCGSFSCHMPYTHTRTHMHVHMRKPPHPPPLHHPPLPQALKVYVQTRLLENAREVHNALFVRRGRIIIAVSAKRMPADVMEALRQVWRRQLLVFQCVVEGLLVRQCPA
jgi:hypothetical protein